MSEYVALKREKIVTSDYTQLNIRQKYKDTISVVINVLLNSGIKSHIKKIILFGSCAKQTTKAGSDVDILVITDEKLSSDTVSDIRRLIDSANKPVEVDLVFYTEDMFETSAMPLTRSIKQNNLVLYDGGVS